MDSLMLVTHKIFPWTVSLQVLAGSLKPCQTNLSSKSLWGALYRDHRGGCIWNSLILWAVLWSIDTMYMVNSFNIWPYEEFGKDWIHFCVFSLKEENCLARLRYCSVGIHAVGDRDPNLTASQASSPRLASLP